MDKPCGCKHSNPFTCAEKRTLDRIPCSCACHLAAPPSSNELTHALNCAGSHWDGDCTCGLGLRKLLAQIDELLQQMIVGAQVYVDADQTITAYKIKTGALHKLAGLRSALFFPQNLPLAESPVETSVATTDHAANLAVAVEAYIAAAARISAGGVEAAEWDSASDTWRAVKTAAHEYRKHFPPKTSAEPHHGQPIDKPPQ